ncbi:MAG: hypothetical protein M5U18_12455 [Dehalococcoidia bacterium]|nr:hypothetical protein [Dehalococcoidia bacterium]
MRRFLLLLAVSGLAIVLLACGGDDGNSAETFPTTSDPARNIPPDQRGKINIVVAGSDFYVGENNFVFGITDANDLPRAAPPPARRSTT